MSDLKVFATKVLFGGSLESSFNSAVNNVQRGFKGIEQSARAMSSSSGGFFSNLSKSARTNFAAIESTAKRTKSTLDGLFGRVGFGGVLVGGGAAYEGFNLIKQGMGIAAERETVATQLHTVLGNQGRADFLQPLIKQLRTYSDMESVFHYLPVADAASQMLVSKYKPEKILPEMRKLGELAKDDDTLKLVADIYSQGNNMGYVTKGLLTRLQKDAKVPIYSALLQAMGKQDTLPNESALFKRLRSPQKDPVPWAMMEKALDILTGEGGALHGHQMAQLQTFQGQASSFDDRIKDVMGGAGGLANVFSMPILKAFNMISPTQIQEVFDRWKGAAQSAGETTVKSLKSGFDWILTNKDKLVNAGKMIVGAFAALKTIQLGAGLVSLVADITPLGVALTAIGVAGALIAANWDKVAPALKGMWDAFSKANAGTLASMGQDLSGIWSDIKDIAGLLKPVVIPAFERMLHFDFGVLKLALDGVKGILDGIKGAADAATGAIKLLSGQHIQVTPTGLPASINPNGSLKGYTPHASGGIFSTPHIGMIGEAGPEAIIPLRGGARSMGLLGAANAAMGVDGNGGSELNITNHFTINGTDAKDITRQFKSLFDQMVSDGRRNSCA